MSAPAQAAMVVLADSDTGKGSPIGLFVLLLLVVAVYFLYRSMSRHMRKVPTTFEPGTLSSESLTDQPKSVIDQPENEEQAPPQPPVTGPRP